MTKKSVKKAGAKKKKTRRKEPSTKESANHSTKRAKKVIATTKVTTEKVKSSIIPWSEFITPLDDRVVVEKEDMSHQTPGGIIIPGSVTSRPPNRGRVLQVGRGHLDKKGRNRPMDVSVGDHILLSPYLETEIELNGSQIAILRESEILGILN